MISAPAACEVMAPAPQRPARRDRLRTAPRRASRSALALSLGVHAVLLGTLVVLASPPVEEGRLRVQVASLAIEATEAMVTMAEPFPASIDVPPPSPPDVREEAPPEDVPLPQWSPAPAEEEEADLDALDADPEPPPASALPLLPTRLPAMRPAPPASAHPAALPIAPPSPAPAPPPATPVSRPAPRAAGPVSPARAPPAPPHPAMRGLFATATAVLVLVVDAGGRVTGAEIERSSGVPALDDHARRWAVEQWRYPALGHPFRTRVPFHFVP